MIVLAIETSCDETAAAIISVDEEKKISVLSERISSQVKLHEAYGGIVPELAAREHLVNLPLLVDQVLSESGISFSEITCLAVTRGPGLKGCLLVGLNYAKGISVALNLPILGINHIEGHVYSPYIDQVAPEYPFLALVVSGGHTEIQLVRGLSDYQVISRTLDDAAGEAFDKSAHLLGLTYPGGAKLAALADKVESSNYKLPSVMRDSEDFSFSGLKTAVLLLIKKEQDRISTSEQLRAELAHSIQNAIVDTIISKLRAAIKNSGVNRVALSGGVAANKSLRFKLGKLEGIKLFIAKHKWCTDNAAMIGYVGALRYLNGESHSRQIAALARWPIERLR